MPALPPYLIEPIWEQFRALLPERKTDHPLGCHRSRIPERVVFEKLVQVLVFGCAYERIADASCSESTLRRRRDEWIELGVMERLREICLGAYDRLIGLKLSEVALDCCMTKAPRGGEKAGRSPVDRGKRGLKRSMAVDAKGIPLGAVSAPANRHDSPLLCKALRQTRRGRTDIGAAVGQLRAWANSWLLLARSGSPNDQIGPSSSDTFDIRLLARALDSKYPHYSRSN